MKNIKGIVFAGSFLILLSSYFINADSTKDITDTFNNGMYNYYSGNEAKSLNEIVDDFNLQQLQYIHVAPPNEEFCWTQDGELTLFNPAQFPANFVTGLVPVSNDGITVYPILVMEDSTTRQTLFFNSNNEQIASVSPRPDYNPDWIALDIDPLLYYSGKNYDEIASYVRFYNPARLMVRYNLILKNDLVKYVLNASMAEKESKKNNGIGIMSAYMGAPVTNLVFTDMEKVTNGIKLTVAYPFDYANYPTNCYTNKLEFFICADLVDGYFTSKCVTNVSSTTNWIEWTDLSSSIIATNYRYYAVGNADMDSDGDGLADAREKFMYHSSPTNSDSDGDGLSDYTECIILHTDPNNNDTNAPAVVIDYPLNNIVITVTP